MKKRDLDYNLYQVEIVIDNDCYNQYRKSKRKWSAAVNSQIVTSNYLASARRAARAARAHPSRGDGPPAAVGAPPAGPRRRPQPLFVTTNKTITSRTYSNLSLMTSSDPSRRHGTSAGGGRRVRRPPAGRAPVFHSSAVFADSLFSTSSRPPHSLNKITEPASTLHSVERIPTLNTNIMIRLDYMQDCHLRRLGARLSLVINFLYALLDVTICIFLRMSLVDVKLSTPAQMTAGRFLSKLNSSRRSIKQPPKFVVEAAHGPRPTAARRAPRAARFYRGRCHKTGLSRKLRLFSQSDRAAVVTETRPPAYVFIRFCIEQLYLIFISGSMAAEKPFDIHRPRQPRSFIWTD
ncbi:hypothetical protein EVAR_74568_1 [Eumeta japonica]|uniref:Uncharacterized protein n=1 Tax=Eumeta variegata TaxID=151549 RepID=A0A4C1TEF4_EUMVA|nr:hypothetical protein EVAR_74568_1 [Eumeta japonica]